MTKEEVEKYINEEVEITIEHSDIGKLTYKGKLSKKDYALTAAIYASHGLKYADDWFILTLDNKEYFNFRAKIVKEIKKYEK